MESARKKLNIGLCGFGAMGKAHSFALNNLDFYYNDLPFEASVRGVCTTSLEKSRMVAKKYGFGYAAVNEDELIGDPEIDIIDICTPNIYHYETVKKALAAKKHIYCEKPLCVTADQAREIARLASESGLICNTVFNNRHLAAIRRAKELVDEGRLGRILSFSAEYLHNSCTDIARPAGWKQDKSVCGGGVLFDLGSHLIDLLSWLCGEFQSVSGLSQIAFPTRIGMDHTSWQTNADEGFAMLAVTKTGAHGTLEVGKLQVGTNDDLSFEIYGERGSLRFSLMDPNHLFFYDNSAPSSPIGGERGYTAIECVGRYPDLCFPSPKAPAGWLYGHVQSMYSFLSSVNEGKPFAPSLSDGAYVQAVMDAAYRSAEQESRLTEVIPCL